MRVIFFGTSAFAVPTLEQLVAARHTIAMCVTQPDRPQGRGLGYEPSAVKRAALQLGLPLAQPERLDVTEFEPLHPEVGVVLAYGKLITRSLLALPAQGMLGVHPSLLPQYRGAAPVSRALLAGETTTGVTIFKLVEALDAGDIICQQTVAIDPEEDAEVLTARLAQRGAQELVRALELMASGRVSLTPQDAARVSYASKLTKAEGQIEWTRSAEEIARLVRATVPWPGATTSWNGQPLKVWAASVHPDASNTSGVPGTVVSSHGETITVATGQGTLALKTLQPAGRRRMSVKQFLAGHPVRVGERFGT